MVPGARTTVRWYCANPDPCCQVSALRQGTRTALYSNKRESITLTLNDVTPATVGAIIALYERAVGLYASLVNINAYHQPCTYHQQAGVPPPAQAWLLGLWRVPSWRSSRQGPAVCFHAVPQACCLL